MKLWIPKCGDAAKLDADWTFNLLNEYRNHELWKKFVTTDTVVKSRVGGEWDPEIIKEKACTPTFPVGTELVFDRIYIRQENKEYASVTFIIKEHPNEDLIGDRFWVKLDEANQMHLTPTSTDNPVGGFAKQRYKFAAKAKKDPTLVTKYDTAKRTKVELELTRDACRQQFGLKHYKKHCDSIVDAFYTDQCKHNSQTWGEHRYYNRVGALSMVENKPWRKTDQDKWHVAATRKLPDGSTERDMRFTYPTSGGSYGSTSYGGFTVTVKDGVVTSVTLLV